MYTFSILDFMIVFTLRISYNFVICDIVGGHTRGARDHHTQQNELNFIYNTYHHATS